MMIAVVLLKRLDGAVLAANLTMKMFLTNIVAFVERLRTRKISALTCLMGVGIRVERLGLVGPNVIIAVLFSVIPDHVHLAKLFSRGKCLDIFHKPINY